MSTVDRARLIHLRALLDAECISYGEMEEIYTAFDELDPATLRDRPENASASDMLDELYAYGVTMGGRS